MNVHHWKFLFFKAWVVNESKCQPNELWVDQGKEFSNSLMQKWLDDNDILMYLTHMKLSQ